MKKYKQAYLGFFDHFFELNSLHITHIVQLQSLIGEFMRELLVIANHQGNTNPAFLHALEIAKTTQAKIELVAFVHAAGVDSSEILTSEEKRKVRHRFIDDKQAEMDAFLETLDLENVKLHVDVVWERSFERWVISRCEQKSFDLILKSAHQKSITLHVPGDWQLIRHSADPVMIVGEQSWHNGGIILAALDLSSTKEASLKLNETILKYSFSLAQSTHSEMHACYSIAMPSAVAKLDFIDSDAYEEKMKKVIDPIISRLISEQGLNRDHLHLVSGRPAKEITRLIETIHADVIVMGNKTRPSLRGRLLGTTVQKVLQKTQADVVVVKN
jgi:universal stress protein E